MPKPKKPDHVSEVDGHRVEFRRRRTQLDADVYGGDGDLMGEYVYPKLGVHDTAIMDAFAVEAVDMAQRDKQKGA